MVDRLKFLSLAALSALAMLVVMAAAAMAQPADPRFSYTETFLRSDKFYDYCIGIACQRTAQYAAARRASLDDAAVVPHLESRFAAAGAPGRLYVALVIRAHDRARGDALLRALAQEKTELTVFSGCEVGPQRLGDMARRYLSNPDPRLQR